jgi:hypothetical protein
MVRRLSMLVVQAISVVACSGSDVSGRFTNQRDGGTTGGASHAGRTASAGGAMSGGVPGSGGASSGGGTAGSAGSAGAVPGGCRFDSDCPALGCYMCPVSYCKDGQCVWGSFPSYGGAGAGGGNAGSGGGGNAGFGGSGHAGSGGGEEDGGTVACGNATCKTDELCVYNICSVGNIVPCQPLDSTGQCPDGWQLDASCTQFPKGGCKPPPCTNPSPYCAQVPSTCTAVPTLATGCSCANSVCRFGACRVVTAKRTVSCDVQ